MQKKDEDSPSDNQEYSLLDNQEHSLSNDHEHLQSKNSSIEQTNNVLTISEVIDLTNLLFETNSQLRLDKLTHNNDKGNSNSFGNMNYSIDDLINRMFEMDNEFDL
ncbi:hypothetical protein F8M41_006200 [Gigaspora margarita]|uniref:Uncharacterized protein n=1 Tax=Gigaspora margarita TaxID=4874 RepID=A0A8H4A4C0_GIGMA|nr:hypothetical protein F8M41_006200 [Gigaspora margarita]